jgi:hypothetical protein
VKVEAPVVLLRIVTAGLERKIVAERTELVGNLDLFVPEGLSTGKRKATETPSVE